MYCTQFAVPSNAIQFGNCFIESSYSALAAVGNPYLYKVTCILRHAAPWNSG